MIYQEYLQSNPRKRMHMIKHIRVNSCKLIRREVKRQKLVLQVNKVLAASKLGIGIRRGERVKNM